MFFVEKDVRATRNCCEKMMCILRALPPMENKIFDQMLPRWKIKRHNCIRHFRADLPQNHPQKYRKSTRNTKTTHPTGGAQSAPPMGRPRRPRPCCFWISGRFSVFLWMIFVAILGKMSNAVVPLYFPSGVVPNHHQHKKGWWDFAFVFFARMFGLFDEVPC